MQTATLVIKDQVNIKFEGLDPFVRRKMTEALKYLVPEARYMAIVRMKRWDGTVSFCSAGGASYINLVDRLLPILEEEKYEIEIDDRRPVYDFSFPKITDQLFVHRMWPEGHELAGQPIMLRDYQVEAIDTYLNNLQSIQQISTGAGKTLLTAALSYLVEPYGRSIIIVPNKNLVVQTEKNYRNVGLDVGVFYGDRKEWNHKHTICTWQSLAIFSKKSKKGEVQIPIDEFIKDVICVMVDEVHSAKAKELKDLLTGAFAKVPIRWGLTGTIPKEEHEAICLLLSLGPMVGQIKAIDLQELGVLPNCRVDIMQLVDDHVDFDDYHSEHDFLLTDEQRVEYIIKMIEEFEGNTLILIDRIEAGKTLQTMLTNSVFISGKIDVAKRQIEYESIQNANDRRIIATYGVAAVGIDIPRLFNIVLFEPGKAFVRTIQSIGRGMRKAHDKDFFRIIDLCSNLKFSKRHLTKRKAFYTEAQYPFNVIKVKYK